MPTRWLCVVALALDARSVLLSIKEPADGACVLSTSAAVAEVFVEDGEDGAVVASVFASSRICFEVVERATGRSGVACGAVGSGEAALEYFGAGAHDVAAFAVDAGGAPVAEARAAHAVAVADDAWRCGGGDAFPLSAATRGAVERAAAARGPGVLAVAWPRPGDVVRSGTLVAGLAVAYANRTLGRVTGTLCLAAALLGGAGELRSCADLEDAEHVELRVPEAWTAGGPARLGLGFALRGADGARFEAPPLDVVVDAREEAPPPLSGDVFGELAGWELAAAALDARPALLPSLDAVLVVCRYDEDLSWLRFQRFPALVYEKRADRAAAAGRHGVPRNTANEASAFLKFIVDYYDALPRAMVFLHGHRYAYHMEDVLGLLADLDVASFDYCNLNFAVWGTHEDPERRLLYNDTHRPWLEAHLGPLPPLLFDRCCAQFLVTRDRVRARPRAFYEAALAHAYYDVEPLPEGDKEANRQIGLLFEWLWHHIFGEPPVDPDVADIVPDIEETDIVYLSGDRRRPRCAPRPGRPRA